MKRIIGWMLTLLLVAVLFGCQFPNSKTKDSVSFYYQRSGGNYVYGSEDAIIAPESREISGSRDNLRYLLTLYFHGPLDSALVSPFPSGTALADLQVEETSLTITLNSHFAQLEGINLTIACTCLARTCFDLTDAEAVEIKASPANGGAAVSVTITRDNVLLVDSIPETTPTE